MSRKLVNKIVKVLASINNMQIMLNSFGGECLEVIVNDTTGEYESDTMHVAPRKMQETERTDWTVKYSVDADFQLKKK